MTTTLGNITTATPTAIDTRLAEISEARAKLVSQEETIWDRVHTMARDMRVRNTHGKGYTWKRTNLELADQVTPAQELELAKIITEESHLVLERAALTDEFHRRGGWSRFYLVEAGHIHSSTHCSTCRPTTRMGWLVELSGQTEAEAVAAHGALLCTVCYPSAPVEWTNLRELEAAAKASAKCAGSGTYLDQSLPHRKGYYSGNWATCPVCGDKPALTSSWKLRAHKPKG